MRRAEQLSKVADPFAEPIRGGVMEVSNDMANRIFCFCVLGCFGFFLGCKSPVLYEIIEVKNGSEVLDMHRWNRGVQGGQMPEVPRPDRAWGRSDFNPAEARQENPATGRAVLG
jgi:hypothetical protein